MKLEQFVKGSKQTRLLYLADSYVIGFQATIVKTYRENQKSTYIILDETAFHPKAGGQPTDTGVINGSGFSVAVRKVMLIDGIAIHWCKSINGEVSARCVTGNVNWQYRYLYMRRHTAGHLFDHCLAVLKGRPVKTIDSWLGDPCYIAYNGEMPSGDVIPRAEAMENQMISEGGKVTFEEVSFEELLRRAPNAPNIYRIPSLKSYRIVKIEGCDPIPCAGTHLRNIREIGRFLMKDVKKTSLGFKIFYDVKDS